MRPVFQLPASMTSVVDAPRLVSSDASPTRPECAVTRLSTPAASAAAVNRSPIICADSGTTRSPGSGLVVVFRRYGDTFRAEVGAALSTAHSRVMTAIEQCRTAALGGHVEQCDHCGHRRVWYNSCRNPQRSSHFAI